MSVEQIPNTYKLGMEFVICGIFALLAILAVVDIVFAVNRSASIGYRLESWSWQNPWLAAVLLVVFGALVAHFVLNPWPS
jgi:uncharacterized integral membrane protein